MRNLDKYYCYLDDIDELATEYFKTNKMWQAMEYELDHWSYTDGTITFYCTDGGFEELELVDLLEWGDEFDK